VEEPITILDTGSPWTRYGIIGAGYFHSSSSPGVFSKHFMSALEDLARSGQVVNFASVKRKLMEKQGTFKDDMEPAVRGNHGMGSIILTPILR